MNEWIMSNYRSFMCESRNFRILGSIGMFVERKYGRSLKTWELTILMLIKSIKMPHCWSARGNMVAICAADWWQKPRVSDVTRSTPIDNRKPSSVRPSVRPSRSVWSSLPAPDQLGPVRQLHHTDLARRDRIPSFIGLFDAVRIAIARHQSAGRRPVRQIADRIRNKAACRAPDCSVHSVNYRRPLFFVSSAAESRRCCRWTTTNDWRSHDVGVRPVITLAPQDPGEGNKPGEL